MNILSTFIEQAGNIWWGILAAIVVVAILYLIIFVLFRGRKEFTTISYLAGVPLLPLLAIQFFLLFGSISIKNTCTDIANWIDAFVPEQPANDLFSRENINEAISQVTSAFPIANKLIEPEVLAEENGYTLGEALTHKVQVYLNWYIVRRVAWSMGFIVLGCIGILFTLRSSSFDLDDIDGLNDLSYENMDDLGTIY